MILMWSTEISQLRIKMMQTQIKSSWVSTNLTKKCVFPFSIFREQDFKKNLIADGSLSYKLNYIWYHRYKYDHKNSQMNSYIFGIVEILDG